MKRIIKVLFIIILILFLSLYFSKYTNSFYENKKVLTDEAILQFEEDLKKGREIDSSNYLREEKDYNNKMSRIGLKSSMIIEKSFKKILKYSMNYLDNLEEN